MSDAAQVLPCRVAPGSPRAALISAEMRAALVSSNVVEIQKQARPAALAHASAFSGVHVAVPTAPFYAVLHVGEELPAYSSSFTQMLECWTIIETLGSVRETPRHVPTQRVLENMGVISVENDHVVRMHLVKDLWFRCDDVSAGGVPADAETDTVFNAAFLTAYQYTVAKLRLLEHTAMSLLGIEQSKHGALATPACSWTIDEMLAACDRWFGVRSDVETRRLVVMHNQRTPQDVETARLALDDSVFMQRRAVFAALGRLLDRATANKAAAAAPPGAAAAPAEPTDAPAVVAAPSDA